jgi:NDP-sugar pyrophosphorylase family protein
MKWYVASSWKNAAQVVDLIKRMRELGEDVYDFTHHSFNWKDCEQPDSKLDALRDGRDELPDHEWFNHPIVVEHFHKDIEALKSCEALVAIFPAGNSTHIEIGFAAGRGCKLYAIAPEGLKRDLLYRVFERVHLTPTEFLCTQFGWG